jgi:hypothetical protein
MPPPGVSRRHPIGVIRQQESPREGRRFDARGGIVGGQQTIAYAVFAVVGTFGGGGAGAAVWPEGLDGPNNAVIMAVLCLVIGMKLVVGFAIFLALSAI